MSDEALVGLLERLGVSLVDRDTVRAALTHPSFSSERGGPDYERLEFLGDAVLSYTIASHLFRSFPDLPEGDLTRMKVALISGKTLAQVAREIGLGEALLLGKGAARDAERDSVLENAFEALIGAVSLELGVDAAAALALRLLGDRLDPAKLLVTTSDPKNQLQELAQRRGLGLPAYEITGQEGPAHSRVFSATVSVDGTVVGEGSGVSKQAAERAAAAAGVEVLQAR